MKKTFVFLSLCLTFTYLYAAEDWQKFPIGPFGGLNNRDSSYAIPATSAQDLLNVDATPGGKSIRKRHGYGVAYTLNQTTSPVHGVYDFFDSNGNEVNLFFSDTKVYGSVGGAAATVLLSSGPLNATWQCTDSLGQAYCVNTSRSGLYKISGSTLSQITTVASTGTMIATAVDRLVMAGFSDAPSRIDFSAASDFTSWGSGSLGTSPAQFTINAPGAKVTHIDYTFGRVMWFKDTSFGGILIGNQPFQSDWVIKTIAFDVGTNDNSFIYREGILYFRGKDGHIYSFDGYSYDRMTKEISGTIASAQTRGGASWGQTSQADFAAGLTNPQGFISSSVVSGSLMGSSFTVTETSLSDFNQGTFSNSYSTGNFVWISTVSQNYKNSTNGWSFENISGPPQEWSVVSVGGGTSETGSSGVTTDHCGTISAQSGSKYADATSSGPSMSNVNVDFIDSVTSATLSSFSFPWSSSSCGWVQKTINSSSIGLSRKSVMLKFYPNNFTNITLISNPFIFSGNNITFYLITDTRLGGSPAFFIDTLEGGYSVSTGTYTSKSYDTNITTNMVSISSVGITINDYTPNLTLQTSNDNSIWRSLGSGITSTSTFEGNRYLRYIASFTVSGSSDALTTLDDVTLVARATGTYASAVHNAPSLTSWDTFGANYQNDNGNISFFVRSSTGIFYASATVNPSWSAITPGAVPTISTNPYFQMASSFSVTAATQNPTINDFTFNWFEGNAADKAYATYFDDRLLWSVTAGTGATTNNKTLVYDMLNQGWFLYDFPSNGFYVKANRLYFGSSSGGYIFKYGDVENDNGVAINSYWKSKDYFGGDPFTTQELANISLAAKTVSNSTATVTYTTNGSSTSAFYFPLSSSKAFIGLNKNLPAGTVGSNFNVQVGNNAVDQPWEIFGIQVGIRPKTWIPGPQ